MATTSPESAAEFEHTGTTYVSSLEHTGDGRTLKKANSYLSQCTTLTAGMSHLSHEGVSVVSESQASVPDLNATGPVFGRSGFLSYFKREHIKRILFTFLPNSDPGHQARC